MSTTTLIVFAAVLVATVVVNDLTLTITMKKKIEELKIERANLNFSLIQNFKMYFDGIRKKEQQDTEFIAEITKQNDILKEQYEALDEAYEHMNSRYMEICEHYSKLLTCWAGVEERYSDCYEQLKYQNERFDKIEKQLSSIGPFIAGIDLSDGSGGIYPVAECPAQQRTCFLSDH